MFPLLLNFIISNLEIRKHLPEMFYEKSVLKFRKSHSKTLCHKTLCQSLFFNKVADLWPAALLKKRLWHWRFPVKFTKFLRRFFL